MPYSANVLCVCVCVYGPEQQMGVAKKINCDTERRNKTMLTQRCRHTA